MWTENREASFQAFWHHMGGYQLCGKRRYSMCSASVPKAKQPYCAPPAYQLPKVFLLPQGWVLVQWELKMMNV